MHEPRAPLRLTDDRITTIYHIRNDAEVCVHAGDAVSPGALLARVAPNPAVVALAAESHLTAEAARRAVERLAGTTVHAEARLASRRSGLVTRAAQAPITGTILGAARSGAVGIVPIGEHTAVRARCGGIVSIATPPRITVVSATKRLTAAIIGGAVPGDSRLTLPGAPRSPANVGAASPDARTDTPAALVAHIASLRMLAAATKSPTPLLIIGAVSEEVAWQFLSATASASEAARDGCGIVVLAGVADAASGAAATALLAPFVGLPVLVDGRTNRLSIVTNDPPASDAAPLDAHDGDGVFRDPHRWDLPCAISGESFFWTFDAGLRTRARRVTSAIAAHEIIPAATLALRDNRAI